MTRAPERPRSPTGEGEKEPQLRFRQTWNQRMWALVPVAAAAVPLVVVGPTAAVLTSWRLAVIVGWMVVFALEGSVGLTLTVDAAVVHCPWPRRIPWSSVRDVTVESRLGGSAVVLVEASRHTRLRAPRSGLLAQDRRLDAKAGEIERWWRAHRAGRSGF